MTDSTLLVIGAGPKALSIAAKRQVLQKLGFPVPELIVVDRRGVATSWSGESGLTDGTPVLGTPPEKDVGFPYDSSTWGSLNATVNAEMMAFSWHSYLMSTGSYSSWIDRGKPQPTHRAWSRYLRWVASRLDLRVEVEEIREITVRGDRWVVSCGDPEHGEAHTFAGDGLVITGTGTPTRVPGQPEKHHRVMDGMTFWMRRRKLEHKGCPVSVAVVGTGETAASIVVALIESLHPHSSIDIISATGVPYSRGESYEESRLFSNPSPEWYHLTEHHRREFLHRTDRGVFSMRAQETIDRAENVRSLPGQVTHVDASDEHVLIDIRYGDEVERAAYDFVVVAIGFNPLSFLSLLDSSALARIIRPLGNLDRGRIERAIGYDLAVEGSLPRLHLPMLAGLQQGPGFPNLSCLGLLSDRVLADYVVPEEIPRIKAEAEISLGAAR
ncbi:MAG TPA: SidA/IucD/PvdA family monooxygenase [Chloroflexota bacterium]